MPKKKNISLLMLMSPIIGLFAGGAPINGSTTKRIHVNLTETAEAFQNPMKGFRPSRYIGDASFAGHEYASIYKHYISYTSLETSASDTVQKIIDYCNIAWAGIEQDNIKVIPRVVILYPRVGEFWGDIPHDGTPAQWNTDALKNRLTAFIAKLAQAWEHDPRVAAVELGLWGKWGEHHIHPELIDGSDRMTPNMQTALGDAATAAFQHKKVMIRYPETFQAYQIGLLWDSFALPNDADPSKNGSFINGLNTYKPQIWQTQMISGEVAFDWGDQTHFGGKQVVTSRADWGSPHGTLSSHVNTDYVNDYIRSTHISSLGWIAEYTPDGGAISANAARMQKEMGYRYVVSSASFPSRADAGTSMTISFNVTNKGNAPFYYNWPVGAALLKEDKTVAWKGTFNVDIRDWMPGNSYDVSGTFNIPSSLATGTYTLALSVNDPSGDLPSLRFANTNYYSGGWTPVGKVGIGQEASDQNLGSFSGLKADTTLRYTISGDETFS